MVMIKDGPPFTELESLQLKTNQMTDDSLASTRRMIQMCEEVRGKLRFCNESMKHQKGLRDSMH